MKYLTDSVVRKLQSLFNGNLHVLPAVHVVITPPDTRQKLETPQKEKPKKSKEKHKTKKEHRRKKEKVSASLPRAQRCVGVS